MKLKIPLGTHSLLCNLPILLSQRDVLREKLITVREGNQWSKERTIWRRVGQEDSTVGCVGGVVLALAREIVTTDMSRRGNEGAQVSIGGGGRR